MKTFSQFINETKKAKSHKKGQVKFIFPNLDEEWLEAKRYPELESAGIGVWKKAASKGSLAHYSGVKKVLGNVNLDFESLDPTKKKRFNRAIKTGFIEMPIVLKFEDGSYDLVGGNTRLAGLVKNGIDPKLLVVDVKNITGHEREAIKASDKPRRTRTQPKRN